MRVKCKFCNTRIKNVTFDLGNSAASNSLIFKEFYLESENTFPLVLYTCPKCFLVQIEEQLSGAEIFNKDYVYFSSMSLYWVSHAKKYSDEIINRLKEELPNANNLRKTIIDSSLEKYQTLIGDSELDIEMIRENMTHYK